MTSHRKDILLSGASGAIGSATARRLASEGYALHLTSRNIQRLKPLQKELESWGAPVRLYQLDLSNTRKCERVVEQFLKATRFPTGMICNAGDYGVLGPFRQVPFAEWREGIERNFLSHAAMIHAFAKKFPSRKEAKASIVVMSGAGLGGNSSFAQATSYSTSKAALTHLVEALAPELLPRGITINAISPGLVLSGMTEQALKAGRRAPHFFEAAQRCRETGGVSPELAADLIAFLLSDRARLLTGRLLSARFDQDILRQKTRQVAHHPNLFRLRRIDNALFAEKKR